VDLMSKIFKGNFYFVDASDDFDTVDDFIDRIERDRYINNIEVFNKQESKNFEWDDDLAINFKNCPIEEYEKYFNVNKKDISLVLDSNNLDKIKKCFKNLGLTIQYSDETYKDFNTILEMLSEEWNKLE